MACFVFQCPALSFFSLHFVHTTNWKLTFTDLSYKWAYVYIFCSGKTSIDTANIFSLQLYTPSVECIDFSLLIRHNLC
ncbi:hypothetical protein GBAR_LOCUS7638, partial [Geodia barretti]